MIPLGDFDSFLREINGHYNDENYCGDDEICFGILLVDYGQEECREWILNYLNEFHFISRKYFNFLFPGMYIHGNITGRGVEVPLIQLGYN